MKHGVSKGAHSCQVELSRSFPEDEALHGI